MSKRGSIKASVILAEIDEEEPAALAPAAEVAAPASEPAQEPAPAPAATPPSNFHAARSAEISVIGTQVALQKLRAELQAAKASSEADKARIAELERDLARLQAAEEQANREGVEFLLIDPSAVDDRMPPDRFPVAFADASFADLVESIRTSGQIEPIVVRRAALEVPHRRYEIITGRRRLRALAKLGKPALARVVEADDAAALGMMYEENQARSDIGALERGRWFRAYLQMLGTTQTELAARFRLHVGTVSQYISLAGLPEEIISRMADPRAISYNKGRRLLELLKTDGAYDRILAALDERKRKRVAGEPVPDPADDVNLAIVAGEGKLDTGKTETSSRRLIHQGRKIGSMTNIGGRWNIRFTSAIDDTLAARLAEDIPKLLDGYRKTEHWAR
jgi:ParB family transcriptional regulator, chromosome partitioning protein